MYIYIPLSSTAVMLLSDLDFVALNNLYILDEVMSNPC